MEYLLPCSMLLPNRSRQEWIPIQAFLRRGVNTTICKERKTAMAQHTVGGSNALHSSTSAPSFSSVLRLRLACGLTTLLGAIISYFALSWDVQWHTFVGRDRTL